MKITSNKIHELDANTSPDDVLKAIALSGVQETPFFVMDVGDLVNKHLVWKSKMPRVTPFYAVKCNDTQLVLEVLTALGTGFDCASQAEIAKVLDLGVDPSRIIFANPAKMNSHILFAKTHNVLTMTFDSESELLKVKQLHFNARLLLRIRCDAAVAQKSLGMKFGCDATIDAPHLLKLAVELGLNVVGISFHVGSGCQEPEAFLRAIAASRLLFDLGTELGFTMDLLDIGGGFHGNRGDSIDEIATVLKIALDDFFPTTSMGDVQIVAEPGRYYVASAYTLATQIHSKRDTMYYISDGLYGTLACIIHNNAIVKPVPLLDNPGKLQSSTVWGPTCDSNDVVEDDIMLPPLNIGDWLIFHDMGAYTISSANTFNGFPIPKVHVVIDRPTRLFLKNHPPLTEEHFTFQNKNLGIISNSLL